MSREKAESVRRVIAEFNATGRLGPVFDALFDSQVEFKDDVGAYSSRSEVRSDLGETIMLTVLQSGRGKTGGVPVAQPFTWVMAFEGNRCVRWRIHADRHQALEAVGLPE